MTDKQIIIDGVDVSGCEFYQIEANELYPKANYCGSMRNTFCEIEPNCYYKQLKRAEQENKEIIEKYRSVLEEIREDLETQIYCECSECGNDDYSECIKCMTKRYLPKISEVIKDEK